MARSIEAGLTEVQMREQGLRVLARMIAQVYARDTRLGASPEPERRIPCCGGATVHHSRMKKTQVKKGR